LLDGRQLSPIVKKKLSDYSINNNSSLTDLKKAARDFIKDYE